MSSAVNPDADRVLVGLRKLYSAPEWAFLTEVRSTTGDEDPDVLRVADALAVNLWPSRRSRGSRVHGFEVKVSRDDLLRELKRPEKSGPLKLFCSHWWLVVPAPWKRIVLSTRDLPEFWGLIEVGTGAPHIVLEATEREPEEPTPGFVRALLRAATREAAPEAHHGAPSVQVTRPGLSRSHVGLLCGHVAPSLAKTTPRALPCVGCAEGRPTDRALVEAAIADASEEEIAVYAEALERRMRGARFWQEVGS